MNNQSLPELADKIAQIVHDHIDRDGFYWKEEVREEIVEELSKQLAAQSAEIERLREETEEYRLLLLEARSVCQSIDAKAARFEDKLKAALQSNHQEPSDESLRPLYK